MMMIDDADFRLREGGRWYVGTDRITVLRK